MRRAHPCDVCGHPRKRWQRLCGVCWGALPHDLRTAVVDGWHSGNRRIWRAAKRAAIEHMAAAVARHMARYQARQDAILGERHA